MIKQEKYKQLFKKLDALCYGETDQISLMATIACELYHEFELFNWVGFYRNVGNKTLKIGPYQGGHGCLVIPFSRGVCGKCAREEKTQNVPDVEKLEYHIACASTTRSELVEPIFNQAGELIAVLDIDSDTEAIFDSVDEENIKLVNRYFTN